MEEVIYRKKQNKKQKNYGGNGGVVQPLMQIIKEIKLKYVIASLLK